MTYRKQNKLEMAGMILAVTGGRGPPLQKYERMFYQQSYQ